MHRSPANETFNLNETQMAFLFKVTEDFDVLRQRVNLQENVMNDLWLLITGIAVMTMQIGFAMLEAGTVETKAVKSVLMKNLGDSMIGGLAWLILGFGTASSNTNYLGISKQGIFPILPELYLPFFHSYAFSVTGITIVSGAVLGRVTYKTYLMFALMFNLFVFPPVSLWGWGKNGLLREMGFVDFAGGMIVHGLGGVSALVGAWKVGVRPGRFYALTDSQQRARVRPLDSNSPSLICLGGLILHMNWLYFNSGSTLTLSNGSNVVASTAIMNTIVALISSTSIALMIENAHDFEKVINASLAGLVSITSGCVVVTTPGAFLIGGLAAIIYHVSSDFILCRCQIDDPLDASSIHGIIGIYGTLMVGLLSEESGLFYGHGLQTLKIQAVGVMVISFWGCLTSFVLFSIIQKTVGLSVSREEKIVGLDFVHHDIVAEKLDCFQIEEFNTRKKLMNYMKRKKKHSSNGNLPISRTRSLRPSIELVK